ncbi:MAG: carboxypeptidase [Cryomorphaceae bacterium]|nr:carboxypeptidase [Cryomorphaceae bacterium]
MRNLTLILFSLFAISNAYAQDSNNRQWPESSVTEHSTTINGKKINYKATAAHLPLHNDKGEQIAQFFYVAYVAENKNKKSKRPITFVFNGGPGSSSVWLHMGALGPKRVLMTEEGLATPPPYDVVDNDYSWLDQTDLVFIDPVETGFSRPYDDTDKKTFTGYEEDIKSVGDFIRHYVSMENRWLSPKYLAGESYGTTRAAGLSGYLQDRHGMYLNGIVLISAVLNFQTLAFNVGNDLPHALFLPSFAATAYAHGKVDKTAYPDRDAFLKEVENFALGEYTLYLNAGDGLSEQEKSQLAETLSNYTGLSETFLRQNHFRINTWTFTKELLRDEGLTIGRFDALVKGRDKSDGGDTYDFDPSYNLSIFGAYTAAINSHLKSELDFHWDETTYEILTGNVRPWNYGSAQNQYINTAETLRSAMHKNTHLKVLVCSGRFDLATPYFATDYTINHMFLAPELKDNIETKYYDAGHMMYSIPVELERFTKDVRDFYESDAK